MKKESRDVIRIRDYVDNQIKWVRILKRREREDILRDMSKMETLLRDEIIRIHERQDSRDAEMSRRQDVRDADVNKQFAIHAKILYIGLGVVLAIQFVLMFLKK